MADTEIMWAGLTLGGDTAYRVNEISGWEDLADINDLSDARTRGHGDHVGDLFSRSRVVNVSGEIVDTVNRNSLVRALQAASQVTSIQRPLTIDLLGLQLTAQARVVARSVKITAAYDVGDVPFALQWRCPDPLRYGPVQTASTGLPTGGGGLAYPLAYPMDYGTAGTTGRLTLTNAGTANAPILFAVTGPLPGGFEISAAGLRLTYPVDVPAGQVIELDTARGTVMVEGTASRRANLTVADWFTIPAGSSLSVQFTPLSASYSAAARLTATWQGAYW